MDVMTEDIFIRLDIIKEFLSDMLGEQEASVLIDRLSQQVQEGRQTAYRVDNHLNHFLNSILSQYGPVRSIVLERSINKKYGFTISGSIPNPKSAFSTSINKCVEGTGQDKKEKSNETK